MAFSACTTPDPTPPKAQINSPANDSTIRGTVTAQIAATDDSGVDRVTLYARGRGSGARGKELGTSTLGTDGNYLVSFNAGVLPNRAELELYAEVTDASGGTGLSNTVNLTTSDPAAPALSFLVAYTVPPRPQGLLAQSRGGFLPVSVRPDRLLPPVGVDLKALSGTRPSTPGLRPQADPPRSYVLQWGWAPVPAADGYCHYLSTADLAGPYKRAERQTQGCFAAGTGGGAQGFDQGVAAKPGDRYWGTFTVATAGGAQEGLLSNADDATVLPPQDSLSPDGASVSNGRPVLNWTANPGAAGYLYYVLDKNPWEATARVLWTNPRTANGIETVAATTAAYPASEPPLPAGTYYWWVAGVSFTPDGRADGLSFSDPKTFTVP